MIELSLGRIGVAILAAIVCGACLGFLRHNFYPARIFMGDSGALLLGYTLATISVEGLLKTAALATLVLPLLVLAVPVLDTSFVVAKRLRSGQPIYVADARHLHHRFMRLGFSERRAVLYLWTWCGTLALAALATRFAPPHHHGHWSVTNVAIDAAAGLAAVAFSLYVVYVLEIVKLAKPAAMRGADEPAPTRPDGNRVTNVTLGPLRKGKTGVTSAGMLRVGAAPATDVLPGRGRQRADRIHGGVHRRGHADRLGGGEHRLRARLRRRRRYPRRRRHDRDPLPRQSEDLALP